MCCDPTFGWRNIYNVPHDSSPKRGGTRTTKLLPNRDSGTVQTPFDTKLSRKRDERAHGSPNQCEERARTEYLLKLACGP